MHRHFNLTSNSNNNNLKVMNKSTLKFLGLILVAIVAFSSCGSLKKMADNAHLVTYSVTPNPLEMHAGMVPVSVNVSFPPKYFYKKAYLIISPYIVSDADKTKEIKLDTKTLQGEKVKDNNDIISYKNGGSVSYKDTFPYEAVYRMSDLELRIEANAGKEPVAFGNVKIADGIITTPELVDQGLKVDNGAFSSTGNAAARTILTAPVTLPTSASAKMEPLKVYFDKQQSSLSAKEQKDKKITDFVANMKTISNEKDKEILSVSLASYASPDGPTKLNESLVTGRTNASEKFLVDKMKKDGVKGADGAKFISRTTTSQEDWDGFKNAVAASKIEDKELILKVLTMYSDWDVRDKEIKNMSKVFPKLASDILPLLRRSEVYVEYKTKQRTKEEILAAAKTNVKDLSQLELFYVAQESKGADKETYYKKYIELYPSDWKALNNLGVYYIGEAKYADAKTYLEKANTAEANNATIMNNLGALYMGLYLKDGKVEDLTKAEEYFGKAYAKSSTDEIGYNLGVILIKQGKYSDAVTKFGTTASFNKALAQLLNGKPENAASTLKSVTSTDGYYYYLKAIAAARQANETEVLDNLKTAIGKNSTLKAYAKKDMEFNKFFENATFKAIVE